MSAACNVTCVLCTVKYIVASFFEVRHWTNDVKNKSTW